MALPVSAMTQTYLDNTREKSHLRLFVTTITAGNFAAVNANIAALRIKLTALTLGNEVKSTTQAFEYNGAPTPPASPLAQRENKYLIRYHDANGKSFSAELPCADLTKLATNSEFVDTTLAAYTDLKTAFEAVVVSPDDGSAVVMDSIQFVGRKS